MKDDLIRRSDAIEWLKEAHEAGDIDPYTSIQRKCYFEEAINCIEEIPTAEPKRGKWIPCSERLPEENEEVLVCDEDGTMEVCDLEMFGRGIGLKWTDKSGYECWLDVVAWMPLPSPWKGADDDSDNI